ncbi:hypothetical protein V491_07711 [Pseudogymnoascus sp. VKM F-3775]|nr:hypothetical protein V491_07711 [Pseudogymnoascus sp. VKM F-3775]
MKFFQALVTGVVGFQLALAVSETPALIRESVASDILDDVENAVTCAACEAVLLALKGLSHLGNQAFVNVLTDVEDDDVCEGLIAAEGPVIAHDLREIKIGSATSKTLCASLIGLCPYPEVTPYAIPFPKPKPDTKRPVASGQAPIQVVHISDTHVDLSYEIGANYNCTKPICCRSYTPDDAPGNNSYPAGEFGNPLCDPPVTLQQSMVEAIKTIASDAAFTVFTGDVVAHDLWSVDKAEVLADLNSTYSILSNLDLVYPVMGNHDVVPVNCIPPTTISTTLGVQWAYDTLAGYWNDWISTSGETNTANAYGAYSVKYPGGKLRVISLNTVFYYTLNFWLYEEPMQNDPNGQFTWLVNELQSAEDAGDNVYIISHIPPGSSDFFRGFSNTFNQIVNRYDATIAAMFYGHTHVDEFEISYSDYANRNADTAVAMSYIAPSMTPTSGSPTFRVYTVDPVTYGILDFIDYTTDITADKLSWTKYYSAKEAYGPLLTPPVTDTAAELTPAFWHNVTTLFETNEAAFKDFFARKSRGYAVEACDGDCRAEQICMARAAESQYNCDKLEAGFDFTKRSEESHAHRDECEGTRLREVFGQIGQDHEKFTQYINSQVANLKNATST